MLPLTEFRDWSNWIAEWVIVLILIIEYKYDKDKDDAKKQRKTRTTKKTTSKPGGETISEETTETSEPLTQGENK